MVRLHARALLGTLALLLGPVAPAAAATRGAGCEHRGHAGGPRPRLHADPGVWGSLRTDLVASGYPEEDVFAWGYDTSQSVNETLSGRFAAYVDQVLARTGAHRVDIVAHSFGSSGARAGGRP